MSRLTLKGQNFSSFKQYIMKKYRKLITTGIITSLMIMTLSGCAANKNEAELLKGVGASNNVEILTPEEQAELEAEEQAAKEEAESESRDTENEEKNEEEKKDSNNDIARAKKKRACKKTTASLTKIVEVNNLSGEFAAYTYNLKTDVYGSYDSHKMQAASLIKVFIAGAVYENWDEIVDQGSSEAELDSLLNSMITVSDNTAANTLIQKLGGGSDADGMNLVNAYCEEHGYKDTHLGRLLLAPNTTDDNYTSVKDCGKFLKEAYNNQLEGAEEILGLMKQQERTGKIPAGVPSDIETANKTGELADVENDIAVIYGEEPYILCVMTENITGSGSAIDGIVSISSKVYDLWEN